MAWANYIEDEKKRKKAESDAATNAGWNNFINKVKDTGEGLVSGIQQGVGTLGDVAVEGGTVLSALPDLITGKSDQQAKARQEQNDKDIARIQQIGKQLKDPKTTDDQKVQLRNELKGLADTSGDNRTDLEKTVDTGEQLRDKIHEQKDVSGNNIVGTTDVDDAAGKIASGQGDLQDFSKVAAKGLETGLDATMFLNPTDAALNVGRRTFGQALAQSAKLGVGFGGASGVESGLRTYGDTGDVGKAINEGYKSAVQNTVLQTGMGVGGHLLGNTIRKIANKNSVADQVAAKDAMVSGDKAAQQATDSTGKPVTQSQVINSAEPEVTKTPLTTETGKPMSTDELAASADRPVGMTMDDYIKQKAAKPEGESKSMAAEVTPGKTDSLQIETKLDDASAAKLAQEIKDQGLNPKEQMQAIKASGMSDAQAMEHFGTNTTGTVTKKPLEVTDEGKAPIDTSTAGQIGDVNGIDTAMANFADKNIATAPKTKGDIIARAGEKITNSWNRATQLGGHTGSEVAGNILKATKGRADIQESVAPHLDKIKQLGKEVSNGSQTVKSDVGKRINDALEDRANADQYLKTPKEKELFDNISQVLDTYKQRMEESGMPVRENYTPYEMMNDALDSDAFAKKGIENKHTNTQSGHAKERTSQERSDLNNENIIDLLPKYSNQMANHISFGSVRDAITNAKFDPHILADKGRTRAAVDYLNKMLQDATPSGEKSVVGKGVEKAAGIYYKNALFMNPKNAAFAQIQKVQAMAETSGEARNIAKSLPKDLKADMHKSRWFGDSTINQDVLNNSPKSQLGKWMRKVDINAKSEESAVRQPFEWGYVDAAMKTDVYKQAIAKGSKPAEAIRAVMDDPEAAHTAEFSGNRLVNDTMFGANSAARPEILRGNGTVKRALGMFQRFGLAQTMYIKDAFSPAETRAIGAIMSADPRNVAIAAKRDAMVHYLPKLEDMKKGAGVKDSSVPWTAKDIDAQIKIVKDAINDTDKVLKQSSSISAPKRLAAVSAMWASSAAVTALWDGMSHYGDDKHQPISAGDAIAQSDPTILSKINPMNRYSLPRTGLNSPMNVISPYGGVNNNSLLNLIPGAGIVNRASGNGLSASLRDMTNN